MMFISMHTSTFTGEKKKRKKSREGFTCDVIDTSARHADLVHDITDRDCQTQTGSAHSQVFKTCKRRFLTNQTINWLKNCCECIFKSIFSDRTSKASSHGVPHNICLAPAACVMQLHVYRSLNSRLAPVACAVVIHFCSIQFSLVTLVIPQGAAPL